MSNDRQLSHRASKRESADAKRDTPKVFLVLIGAMLVGAVGIMAAGAKFIFH